MGDTESSYMFGSALFLLSSYIPEVEMASIKEVKIISVTAQADSKVTAKLSYTVEFSDWEVKNKAQFIASLVICEQENQLDTYWTSNENKGPGKLTIWHKAIASNDGSDYSQKHIQFWLTADKESITGESTVSFQLGVDTTPPNELVPYLFLEPAYRAAQRSGSVFSYPHV